MKHLLPTFFAFLGYAVAFNTCPAFYYRPPSTSWMVHHAHHMDRAFTADSDITVENIPFFIANIDKDNFEETLSTLEPLLLHECRGDMCSEYVEDLRLIAEQLGKEIPDDFAALHP